MQSSLLLVWRLWPYFYFCSSSSPRISFVIFTVVPIQYAGTTRPRDSTDYWWQERARWENFICRDHRTKHEGRYFYVWSTAVRSWMAGQCLSAFIWNAFPLASCWAIAGVYLNSRSYWDGTSHPNRVPVIHVNNLNFFPPYQQSEYY